MGLRLAIFLLSAAVLAYEILLTRLLAIVQWHHFTYLVISLALLGYGASGTFLSLWRRALLRRYEVVFLGGTVGFALLSFACFVAAQTLRFNPLEIVWSPAQLGPLLLLQLLLALPFFAAATSIGLTFMRFEAEIPRIYRADLLGAGVGAGLIVLALTVRRPGECLPLISGVALLAAACVCLDHRLKLPRVLSLVFTMAGLGLIAWRTGGIELQMSEYKDLDQALQVPGSRVVLEKSSPLGLISVLESTQIPPRHAPGLSLTFPGEIPEQLGVFVDGGSIAAIDHRAGDPKVPEYLDYLPTALPYELFPRRRVAVVGSAGGSQVILALRHDSARVDLIEANPQMLELLLDSLRDFAGDPYGHPSVRLHVADARGFFSRCAERFDLIQVAYFDSGGGSAGNYGLSESYFYTVESVVEMIDHLRPGGVVAITQWLTLPPRASLKLLETALEALERSGIEHPHNALALIRTWDSVILLLKNGELEPSELSSLKHMTEARSFDLAYYPGIRAVETNRFNVLDEPYFYDGVTALLGPHRREFLEEYAFDLEPATDDRPYFHHFFKWKTLPELYRQRVRGGPGLVEWGYILLIAALAEATLLGLVLILVPLGLFQRRRARDQASLAKGLPIGLYFLSLGLAFLFLEIAFIQRFLLFLAHPVYAVAIVVAAFLVFAGLGSGFSRRWSAWWFTKALKGRTGGLSPIDGAAVGIATLGCVYLVGLPSLLSYGVGWPLPIKALMSIALIAPMAFLMGMPFPLGLERVAAVDKSWIPWAWGLNGWASVLSALIAVLIAIHLGFTAVVVAAIILYLVAAGAIRRVGEGI